MGVIRPKIVFNFVEMGKVKVDMVFKRMDTTQYTSKQDSCDLLLA